MQDRRPDRTELFGFYYLGLRPDGTYKFANIHHVASWYRVSGDAVLRWLEEFGMDPATVSSLRIELAAWSVNIQLELGNLTPEGVRARVAEALAAYDAAQPGRKPWRDGPIT